MKTRFKIVSEALMQDALNSVYEKNVEVEEFLRGFKHFNDIFEHQGVQGGSPLKKINPIAINTPPERESS